jgi:hypothetical protein
MIDFRQLWRTYKKDKIFLWLMTVSIITFISMLLQRHSSIERTPMPFNLGLLFFAVNMLFANLTLRREPLLAYMFLTAVILLNCISFFFFRYLMSVQTG